MSAAKSPDQVLRGGGVMRFNEEWIREGLQMLPNLAKLYGRLLLDRRVPTLPKAFLLATVGYVLSPIDVLPDIIPVFGQLDELLLISLGLHYLMRAVGPEILLEHWDGADDLLEVVSNIIDATAGLIPLPIRSALGRLLTPTPQLSWGSDG